jgi:dihydrofolate reductase
MKISLIAAVSTNFVIGRGSSLPWEMPADMRYFQRTTLGHHVIMGRTSFEDILHATGKPLSGRTNLVLTRNPSQVLAGNAWENVAAISSLHEALEYARAAEEQEVFIIGGEHVFRHSLDLGLVERMYITWIHGVVDGDTMFPRFDTSKWREIQREDFPADAEHCYPYSFTIWEQQDH